LRAACRRNLRLALALHSVLVLVSATRLKRQQRLSAMLLHQTQAPALGLGSQY